MLKPIKLVPIEAEYGTDSPIVACEKCGKTGASNAMINVMICIGSPGHPSLRGFQCPQIEHWACSSECWLEVANACLNEHMHVLLQMQHAKLKGGLNG